MKHMLYFALSSFVFTVSTQASAPENTKSKAEGTSTLRTLRASLKVNKPATTTALATSVAQQITKKIDAQKTPDDAKKNHEAVRKLSLKKLISLVKLSAEEARLVGANQETPLKALLGKIIVGSRPATGGKPEVDSESFFSLGYYFNASKAHKPGELVLVYKEKKYYFGAIADVLENNRYSVQFENEQVATIHALAIARRPAQK